MFHAVELLAGARAPLWTPSSADLADETFSRVRNRVRAVPHSTVRALRLPKHSNKADPLIQAMHGIGDAEALAAVAHVITDGDLVVPGPSGEGDGRPYILASVVEQPESAQLVVVRLTTARRGSHDMILDADLKLGQADESGVREALRQIYLETESPEVAIAFRGRATAPRAYWLGAPRDRAGLPDNWVGQLEAVAAIDGYQLKVVPDPASDVRRLARELADRRPELVAFWRPWLPSSSAAATLRQACGGTILDVDETGFEDVLTEFSMHCEECTVVPQRRSRTGPATMAQALTNARARTDHLVYLEEAELSAADSPYVRPEAIEDALVKADAVAAQYAEGPIEGGLDAAMAAAGLNYTPRISNTAKGKYEAAYSVKYEGAAVLLGPHLRFGKGSPRTCARIYFYLDSDRRRIVVGHVGRHLPDKTSG